MKKVLLSFAAGAVGGLLYCLSLWLLSDFGVCRELGVAISVNLSSDWLYQRIVWGGIWGLLFLLPLLRSHVFSRGLIFSLVPAGLQLFYFYPFVHHKGLLGLELGLFTPVLILMVNFVWGIGTVLTLKIAK